MAKGKVVFSLLLSHHPPAQYTRTLRLSFRGRKVRICARCTGELLGLLITIAVYRYLSLLPVWLITIVAAVFPLAAIIDWSTQANEMRESTNVLRLVTGAMFSCACVLVGRFLAFGLFWAFALAFGVILLEGVIALKLLKRAGAIERVLAPFEEYAESLTKS